jgi:hypothetical protein
VFALTAQLVDQGKVSDGDIESELSLHSESLKAALEVISSRFLLIRNFFSSHLPGALFKKTQIQVWRLRKPNIREILFIKNSAL